PTSFSILDPATPELYTLSLHDALPICVHRDKVSRLADLLDGGQRDADPLGPLLVDQGVVGQHFHAQGHRPLRHLAADAAQADDADRKSTRLNSSHVKISYAVFCLKKKK